MANVTSQGGAVLMDMQAAVRESFTTGRPCTYVDDHVPGGLEITVHPDGRVCGRSLACAAVPPALPAEATGAPVLGLWDDPPSAARIRRGWRRRRRGAA